MPFKAREQSGEPRQRKKPSYRVTHAHEYNQSLKKRGQLSLYCPRGDLQALLINTTPYVDGVAGQELRYTPAYIELIYTFYRLLGFGLRQTAGFMEDYWASRGLEIAVPSFGHLSDRFAALDVKIEQHCERLAARLARGEAVTVIVDSTGMRFGRACAWYEKKYGKKPERTPWRRVHLSIDPDMNVHGIALTDTEVSDSEGMTAVLPDQVPVDCVIGDTAYYSIERTEAWSCSGVLPVIPPPAHAVVHGKANTRWHDQLVGYLQKKGVHAFRNKFGYGKRALVEAQISRIKRCIGERLLTRKIESQQREVTIIANLLNQWNAFGRCVCVKHA